MDKVEIKSKLLKIISRQLGIHTDEIKDDSSFVDDLGADSLDEVEALMDIEAAFDIGINDDDAEKLERFEQIGRAHV